MIYTLHGQSTSLWFTSWIWSKCPLHHSRREQWRSGVRRIQSWILQASGGFSLYLDSQDGDGLEETRGECQFSSVQFLSVQCSFWNLVLWIPFKHPLHLSSREKWSSDVQQVQSWILQTSGGFSLYLDSQEWWWLRRTHGVYQLRWASPPSQLMFYLNMFVF